jgi:Fe(3+) dicitrate transport protein
MRARRLALCLLLLAPPAAAQQLAGVVLGDDGPLRDARVAIRDGDGRNHATVTDATGAFLARAGAGPFIVVTRAAGFRTRTDTLAVWPTQALTIRLEPAVVHLEPLNVVSARPGADRRLPGSAVTIERADRVAARAVAAHDLIRRVAGAHITDEDPLGLNLNIGVRGMNPRRSSRVLLLEDGVPIQLGPYADPSAHYQPPVHALDRIEVVKGSGQIIHGPQTVGGVINFLRTPAPYRPSVTGLVSIGDRGMRTAHLRAGTGGGHHGVAVSWDRREAAGSRRNTGHVVEELAAQARIRVAGGSLQLRAARFTERSRFGEAGLTQAEWEIDPFMNPTPHDRFTLDRMAVLTSYTRDIGSNAGLSVLAYGQDVDRASWRQASSSGDRFGSTDYAADFGCAADAGGIEDCGYQGRPRHYRFAGIEPRVQIATAAGTIDTGVRLHHETAHRMQYLGADRTTRGAELTRDNMLRTTALSAFTRVRSALGGVIITPGLRVEHVRASNENRVRIQRFEDEYTQLLPGIGMAVERARIAWFAGVHRGFAPPRPADVLSAAPGEGLVQVEPETSWSYEAGMRARVTAWLRADVTLFRTDFVNQVVEGGADAGQRFVNAGATLHRGVEAALVAGWQTGDIRPVAEVTYTLVESARFRSSQASAIDGVTDVRGHRLPYAPRHVLHVTAGFDASIGTTVRLRMDHTSSQFSDDLNTVAPEADGQRGLLPAYTVFGATANQDLGHGIAAFARIDNIGNVVYISERLEGIFTGMPRRFSLGVEYTY